MSDHVGGQPEPNPHHDEPPQLGVFSLSLDVADLAASRDFYERLGFIVSGGDGETYLILRNGESTLGLFRGLFDRNILTFNPGLTVRAEVVEQFQDVREIQAALRSAGLELSEDTDPDGTDPAHISLIDPDGNPILIDQFFPRPT